MGRRHVRREHHRLRSPAIGADGDVIVYGHWGRPLLVFPSEQGAAGDYASNGMVDAVGDLIEGGRVKLYCVGSFDAGSWQLPGASLEERARRHGAYEDWIVNQVIPAIHHDCGGAQDLIATGCSMGAYHAANLALRRADLVPLAICQSGVYDVAQFAGGQPHGERGDAVYFHNPMDYIVNAGGDHLGWLRWRVSLLLVAGQGAWEDTTGALESSRRFSALLAAKGIRHELDVWGWDAAHDWPTWRLQLAHHLPRFC
jgi:esterase/lipase superfamily enzyme